VPWKLTTPRDSGSVPEAAAEAEAVVGLPMEEAAVAEEEAAAAAEEAAAEKERD